MSNSSAKLRYIVPIAFLIIVFSILIYRAYDHSMVKKEGIYTIAKRVRLEEGGARFERSIYSYTYNSNTYKYGVRDGGMYDKVVFVKLNPDKPSSAFVLNTIKVPKCLMVLASADTSWKELPMNVCEE